jgi:hypothetical protein
MSDRATCLHEAAHASAALVLGGRRVERVSVDEADVAGRVTMPLTREAVGPEDLIISLIGWMADGTHPSWPPAWPVREDELDEVGTLVRALALGREQYESLIQIAKKLLRAPEFRRLMNLVARALAEAPVIDEEGVRILYEAGTPIPEQEQARAA